MAIKLSASLSKKVPIEGLQYSSQSFGGSLEIEIGTDTPDEIKQRLHHLYESLAVSIDAEIAAAHGHGNNGHAPAPARTQPVARPAAAQPAPAPRTAYPNTRSAPRPNGNGKKTTATEAQCRAIFAITKSLNIDLATYLAEFRVTDAAQLPIKTASQIIDELKAQQNGAPAQQ
jgi:hypothetical protein